MGAVAGPPISASHSSAFCLLVWDILEEMTAPPVIISLPTESSFSFSQMETRRRECSVDPEAWGSLSQSLLHITVYHRKGPEVLAEAYCTEASDSGHKPLPGPQWFSHSDAGMVVPCLGCSFGESCHVSCMS